MAHATLAYLVIQRARGNAVLIRMIGGRWRLLEFGG